MCSAELNNVIILSWNMNGKFLVNLTHPDFRNKLFSSLDVLLVQETHLDPLNHNMIPNVDGFDKFAISREMPFGRETFGGVAAFVRRSLKAELCDDLSSPDLMVLRIADKFLVNSYVLPANSKSDYRLWQDIHPWKALTLASDDLDEVGGDYGILGDLNTRVASQTPSPEHPPRKSEDNHNCWRQL
ncbi:hypothetical protein C8F01DRAFT_1253303 [Mycena amicta]|nr:hypothetical protein C8F01DRAFT_1253303 [Mycena amicta]